MFRDFEIGSREMLLVTNDRDLAEETRAHGGEMISFEEFIS
jgi:hypothetical protein